MNAFFDGLPAFWDWLLLSTLQACVLVCVIRVIQLLLRKRLAARWHYALWLLLVARMLMPFAPESSVSVFNLFTVAKSPATTPSVNLDVGAVPALLPIDSATPETSGQPLEALTIAAEVVRDSNVSSAVAAVAADSEPSIWAWAFGNGMTVWLVGAVLFLAYVLRGTVVLGAKLRRAPALEDARALAVLDACCETMGIRAQIRLVATSDDFSGGFGGVVVGRAASARNLA